MSKEDEAKLEKLKKDQKVISHFTELQSYTDRQVSNIEKTFVGMSIERDIIPIMRRHGVDAVSIYRENNVEFLSWESDSLRKANKEIENDIRVLEKDKESASLWNNPYVLAAISSVITFVIGYMLAKLLP